MGAVSEGMMKESELEEEIELLQTYEEKEEIRLTGLYEIQEAFQKQSIKKSDLQQAFEKYEAEQNQKIQN